MVYFSVKITVLTYIVAVFHILNLGFFANTEITSGQLCFGVISLLMQSEGTFIHIQINCDLSVGFRENTHCLKSESPT